MKLNGKITLLINTDKTTIELIDDSSSIIFATATLTPEQLLKVLSRHEYVSCEMEVNSLEKVGKKLETDSIVFEVEEIFHMNYREDKGLNELHQKALNFLNENKPNEGWIPDKYYASQNSFFKEKNKYFARTTIRRYV